MIYQCSCVIGELSDVQWVVLLTAIVDCLHCWTVYDYGNTSISRGVTAVHIHMTRLTRSKFIRHCLVGFYMIWKPSGLCTSLRVHHKAFQSSKSRRNLQNNIV